MHCSEFDAINVYDTRHKTREGEEGLLVFFFFGGAGGGGDEFVLLVSYFALSITPMV